MRIGLIVNPTATGVSEHTIRVVRSALEANHSVTQELTEYRGHASTLASELRDSVDAIMVLAGDGTLNEVANGLAGSATALGALPGGSTSVFSRTLGFATRPMVALGQMLEALEQRSFQHIGLGSANSRYFLMHAGFGLDAATIELMEKHPYLKRFAAHPTALGATVHTWFSRVRHSLPTFQIQIAGGERIRNCGLAIVSNSDPYTFLGRAPVRVNPEVSLNSRLGLTAFTDLSTWLLLRSGALALTYPTQVRRSRKIVTNQNILELSVTGPVPVPFQLDGDVSPRVETIHVRHHPSCLFVVVPKHVRPKSEE